VAVKVTELPAQIVLEGLAEIVTPGVTGVFTTIVMVFETSVGDVTHKSVEVIVQVMASPFARADEE
jgi:hypothetical protein